MTELLQRVIAEIEKLPEAEQDAIATRLLAELKDEQSWQVRFESTTDEQWDLLAAKVCQEITEEEFETMVDRLTDEFAKSVGENVPLLSDYAMSREGIYEEHP
ncbi:hypothetical protein NIES2119_15125 [[Phormidium ambiguum] IAM M-71]|uniref:Uncharacterized protein n=2 Tax=[Phormidium ambiguum] IAM M-71 TaxID=454136 RepID=A0A1U7IIZ2_9CYAN|nr:hypothetical protein NIES2119_15125 [Phormidium ambiguum IAM M-71]